MKYGFTKIATANFPVKIGDCEGNTKNILNIISSLKNSDIDVVVFPELCLTGATCGDLFFQSTLLDGVLNQLKTIKSYSTDIDTIFIIGAPILNSGVLYNCGIVFYKGEIIGIVPKTHLTSKESRIFSEKKDTFLMDFPALDSLQIPFGPNVLFVNKSSSSFSISVEFSSSMFSLIPHSVYAVEAGANLICVMGAIGEEIGVSKSIETTLKDLSLRCSCSYALSMAGIGESTTDEVFTGQSFIVEDGCVLMKSNKYETGIFPAIIDLDKLSSLNIKKKNRDVSKNSSFISVLWGDKIKDTLDIPKGTFNSSPFLSTNSVDCLSDYKEAFDIQVNGLMSRIRHTGSSHIVLGISGGLDSSLAILVMVEAMNRLGRSHSDIVAVSMPCFGTTDRTKNNAEKLSNLLGCNFREINIGKSVLQHFKDIGHDPNVFNSVFENTQARERTQVIMDVANQVGGFVVGTGDLSELAQGWCTYNGDHMSMYAVNADIPKTFIRPLIRYIISNYYSRDKEISNVLEDICATPVSPELLPTSKDGDLIQETEKSIGPYELHDFTLFYMMKYGFSPKKIFFMECLAFKDKYDEATIKSWMKSFYKRFFSQQFKRSCMTDGPKIFSLNLSPRGGLSMPSDATATLWLNEIDAL